MKNCHRNQVRREQVRVESQSRRLYQSRMDQEWKQLLVSGHHSIKRQGMKPGKFLHTLLVLRHRRLVLERWSQRTMSDHCHLILQVVPFKAIQILSLHPFLTTQLAIVQLAIVQLAVIRLAVAQI